MLNGVSVVLEIVGTMLGVNYLYGRKLKFGIYDAVFLVSELCIVESANFLEVGKQIIVVSYLVIFLYQMFKFKVGIKSNCVAMMLLICILVALQLTCLGPLSLLDASYRTRILVLLANSMVIIVIALLGVKGVLHKLYVYATRYEWFMNMCLICCSLASLYLIIVYKYGDYLRYTDYIIFGIWTILLCAIIMKWQRTKEQVYIKEKELEMQQIYAGYAQSLLKSVRKRQHDFDNFIQAMFSHIQMAATMEELLENQKAFVRDIKKDNHYNKLLNSGNSLVVGFLYSKFIHAESVGCEVIYVVQTKELESRVPLYLLIKMIGSLFDNAVEAVSEQEEKELFLLLTETEQEIELVISNPFEFVPQTVFHDWLTEGHSTKGEMRGFGLPDVVRLSAEYDFIVKLYNKDTPEGNRIEVVVNIQK